ENVLGNMGLSIDTEQLAVGTKDGRGIVIPAIWALLEKRAAHEDNPVSACGFGQRLCRRPRNWFGERESRLVVGPLAKVAGAKKLRESDDLGPLPRCLPDTVHGLGEVICRRAVATHLDEANCDRPLCVHARLRRNTLPLPRFVIQLDD